MGHDVRAWPMLALLLVVVLVGVGCVLWFMREAMRNERMAVRGKLAEAYRSQLSLLRAQTIERWNRSLGQLDGGGSAPAKFARHADEGFASSLICFDATGRRSYPAETRPPIAGNSPSAAALQAQLREFAQNGKKDEAAQFVLDRFADTDSAVDAEGRLVSANAELLALELLHNKDDPRFRRLAARLRARIVDYHADTPPSGQRRFIMRALEQLDPSEKFPTLAAEELANRYLETNPVVPPDTSLHPTELSDVWAAASPGRGAVALFTTDRLRAWIAGKIPGASLPEGVGLATLAPGEDPTGERAPLISSLGAELPGWRLSISLDDRSLSEAASRLRLHVIVASAVIAAMTGLAVLIARGLGRQIALARIKNDLVATVSHELKTPLTAMRALVETLLDTERLDEKTTREYLQLLAAENGRLSRLIDNFLTFSRLEQSKFAFQFARLQPRTIVDGALAALGERCHAPGCHIDCRAPADLPVIIGDQDALTIALLNLLDNALKYSGGEKQIVLSSEAHNGSVRFSVQDNGIGLSKDECERIFHRFYQVDQRLSRAVGGCGLGLGIVQSIVAAHGGSVSVASEMGRGSLFTVEIPIVPDTRQ
jgi:signal transduction histidine kinase